MSDSDLAPSIADTLYDHRLAKSVITNDGDDRSVMHSFLGDCNFFCTCFTWSTKTANTAGHAHQEWIHHVAAVLCGVYAITPLPEKPRRKYSAAYRAANGNIIPVGAENIRPEYVQTDLLEWRRDDPDGSYFIAYRDVPLWREVQS